MRWAMGDGRWRISLILSLVSAIACAKTTTTPSPARIPPPRPTPAPIIVEPERRPPRPSEGTIDGPAGALWYHIVGRGPDTVIVPLASWLESSLAPLGDRHTIVFYDPRYRGRSVALTDSLKATFQGDIDDLEAVRASIGVSKVAVIGYDYYAAVAAAWAALHPQSVSRLALLSPIEPADTLAQRWNPAERMFRIDTVAARALVKARAAGRDTTDPAGYCEQFWRVNAKLFVGDTVHAAAVRTTSCQLPNESPARVASASGFAIASLGPAVDFGARAAGISVPTLVLHGRLDLVSNPEGAREWTRRIDGARLLWLSNVGHLPFLEAPQPLLDALGEFLSGSWPPRAGPP